MYINICSVHIFYMCIHLHVDIQFIHIPVRIDSTFVYVYYLHDILHIYIYITYIIYITSYITSYIYYSLPCVVFLWDGFRSECSEPYPWSHDTSPTFFDLPQYVPMHCPQKKQHLNFPARIFQ